MFANLKSILSKFVDNTCIQYGLLGVITLLGALLRLYKLGEWSFWIDEIYTINHAKVHFGSLDAIINNIPPVRNWVPISTILIARVLNFLGTSEWSARLVPAVIGIITVPILYFPTKRVFGWQVALMAALLLAVSPWHIFWSQNARFYTSILLLSTLAAFVFYLGIENDRPVYILLYYVLLYFASSERLFALLLMTTVLCYVLFIWFFRFERPKGFNKRMLGILFVPIILLVVIDALRMIGNGSSIIQYTVDTFFGQTNTTPLRLSLSIIYRIGIPIFILGIFGGVSTVLYKKRRYLYVFINAVLPIFIVISLSMFFFTVDRYIFTTLPFWLILGALVIVELFSLLKGNAKLFALGVLIVVLTISISEIYLYNQFQNGNRPDWKQAFAAVQERSKVGDLVVTTRPELGEYYMKEEVTHINGLNIDTIGDGNERIWFVIDNATGWVYPEMKKWVIQNGEFIDIIEVYLPGRSLSIYIFLYDPYIEMSCIIFDMSNIYSF